MKKFVQINPENFTLVPGETVVKYEEYSSYLGYREIVDEASSRGKQIIAKAEAVKQQAREDGYEAGYQAAKNEQSEAMIKTLSLCRRFLESRKIDVVDLSMSVAKKVLGDLDEDTVVLKLIEKALNNYSHTQKITVCVAPQQFLLVNDKVNSLKQLFPNIYDLYVKKDERVEPGSCLLETDIGVVSANLDQQISLVENALRRSLEEDSL